MSAFFLKCGFGNLLAGLVRYVNCELGLRVGGNAREPVPVLCRQGRGPEDG